MAPTKDIGLGVVGTGLGAALLTINRAPDSRLQVRGLHDPDPDRRHERHEVGKRLQSLAEESGVSLVAREYEELLACEDIHAIAVFSPCPCHFAQVKAALLAGKHAIVTKPMAVSLDEARELVALVDRTGLKLLVAQSMRWNSSFQAIHDLFTAGALGEIRLAESYYVHDLRPVYDRSPWRYEMPQDLMYGGVCHPVDLLRWFLGEVDEVFAYGSYGGLDPRYPADKQDNFVISLRYRSGVIARVLGAYETAVAGPAVRARLAAALGAGAATTLATGAGLAAIATAAAAGDALASRILDEEARYVALGIVAISAVTDPEVVVLSGGVGAIGALLEPVREHVATLAARPPRVVTGLLGERAPLVGAIGLALDLGLQA
jgi:predicted dehydrogenase